MCELCHRPFKLDEEHRALICRILHDIIRNTRPRQIFLFGSFARGEWHDESDVDLYMVAQDPAATRAWLDSRAKEGGFPLEVEAFIYSPEEHQALCLEGGDFITRVRTEGFSVYHALEELPPTGPDENAIKNAIFK